MRNAVIHDAVPPFDRLRCSSPPEMATTGLERGDPSSNRDIPQMVVPKCDPHHLLAEEQAAAATLSSLMPYVSALTGTSQPSWVRRGERLLTLNYA